VSNGTNCIQLPILFLRFNSGLLQVASLADSRGVGPCVCVEARSLDNLRYVYFCMKCTDYAEMLIILL